TRRERWGGEPSIWRSIESCRKLHFHRVLNRKIDRTQRMFRDEGEEACKGVNRGRDENHEENAGGLDLKGWRRRPHHKTQGPASIPRKGEDHHFTAAKTRPEV